jgi:hypothetical protein
VSTNFLQWNPAAENQESDAAYAADAQRAGGAVVGSIFQSPLANKLFYQATGMVLAIAQTITAQGLNAEDSNIATLAANLQQAIRALCRLGYALLSYASTMAFNAAQDSTFETTLTGNVTSSTLSGQTEGQIIFFVIHQNSAGGHTFVWPTGVNGAPISTTANSTSVQGFLVISSGAAIPCTPLIVN